MSKGVRYTMVPELRFQAMQKVLRAIATIERDWREERVDAAAAIVAISVVIDMADDIPELQDDDQQS